MQLFIIEVGHISSGRVYRVTKHRVKARSLAEAVEWAEGEAMCKWDDDVKALSHRVVKV